MILLYLKKIKKKLSKFAQFYLRNFAQFYYTIYNKEYFDYLRANDTESTYGNMKDVAYLLDTQVWGVYKGDMAEYAIGGPPIELVLKSCNAKNSTNYLAKVDTDTGYTLSLDGGASWIPTSGYDSYDHSTFDRGDLYFANSRFYDGSNSGDVPSDMICASPMACDYGGRYA